MKIHKMVMFPLAFFERGEDKKAVSLCQTKNNNACLDVYGDTI